MSADEVVLAVLRSAGERGLRWNDLRRAIAVLVDEAVGQLLEEGVIEKTIDSEPFYRFVLADEHRHPARMVAQLTQRLGTGDDFARDLARLIRSWERAPAAAAKKKRKQMSLFETYAARGLADASDRVLSVLAELAADRLPVEEADLSTRTGLDPEILETVLVQLRAHGLVLPRDGIAPTMVWLPVETEPADPSEGDRLTVEYGAVGQE